MNQALQDLEKFSNNLLNLFQEMSDCFSNFQKQSGLNCPSTCGHCCTYPDIEATPREMIPMALYFYKKGEADAVLKKIEEQPQYCVSYIYKRENHDLGKCGHYSVRPSVCRMFGVYGYQDKGGKTKVAACKILNPHLKNKNFENAPLMVDWNYKMMSLDAKLVSEKMPINMALKKALEEVMFKAQFD
jgi:Fe-S-cluster containining protein